jgi:hypothetical protein
VIRGQHQQHRIDGVGIAADTFECRVGRKRNRRCGVAPEGLEYRGARCDVQLPQLLRDQEPVRLVAHNHRRGRGETLEAQCRLLQHGARTGEGQQLLGI